MPTVPQPYNYLIADIPGGQFTGQTSDHLLHLIQSQLPNAINPVLSSDSVYLTVSFDQDLSTDDKTTLDNLVEHSADYFIVTKDGGTTDLGEPALVSTTAGLQSSTTITLQYKMGDGTNFAGFGEGIQLHAPIMTINKLSGNFDNNGKFEFIIGAELDRGEVSIIIDSDALPERTLIASWT